MCGRIKTPEKLDDIRLQLQVEHLLLDYAPRYNVPPTVLVPVVTSSDGKRHLSLMRWGLVPAWANAPIIQRFAMKFGKNVLVLFLIKLLSESSVADRNREVRVYME